jgi:hypothetical protein
MVIEFLRRAVLRWLYVCVRPCGRRRQGGANSSYLGSRAHYWKATAQRRLRGVVGARSQFWAWPHKPRQ